MKTLQYNIPGSLEKIFKSYDYEEDGGMVISGLTYQDKDLVVTFNLYPSSDRQTKHIWELKIINIAAENFKILDYTFFFLF